MKLRRELGLVDAVGVGLGAIVGAGIFVVSGIAAGVAGPAFLVGLAIAGAVATCNALTSAELAAVFPQSGGTYEYGYRLLHPLAGFAAGWVFLASKLAAASVVALGFGSYVAQLFPALDENVTAIVSVIILTCINLAGVKKAGRLNTIIVAITLGALIVFVVTGASSFDPVNLRPFAPFGWRGILESAAILFFAYTGYARVATLGEEVIDPSRTIPRAIVITIVSALVLYAAVAVVAVGAVGSDEMAGSTSPLRSAAQSFDNPYTSSIVAIGAATAMLGVLASQILAISRMMFSMARRNDLPQMFARVGVRYGVPHIAIFASGAIILVAVRFGTLAWVVSSAAFSILLYYAIANVAALRLDRKRKRFPAVIAMTGLVTCIVLAFALPWRTIAWGAVVLMSGFMVRWLSHRLIGHNIT